MAEVLPTMRSAKPRGCLLFADELRRAGHTVHAPIFVGEGDIGAARALVASTDRAKLFLYPGAQHYFDYFADSSLPSYDAAAAALLMHRVLEFLRAKAAWP